MKGSEKQIKWALEIINSLNERIDEEIENWGIEDIDETDDEYQATKDAVEVLMHGKRSINAVEDSAFIIDNRDNLLSDLCRLSTKIYHGKTVDNEFNSQLVGAYKGLKKIW